MHLDNMDCCGWGQIGDLQHSRSFGEAIDDIADDLLVNSDQLGMGAIQFTANTGGRTNYATRFAAQLRKHKFGKVVKLKGFRNPNTGNPITTFVWYPNKRNVLAYCRKHKLGPYSYSDDYDW